MGVFILPSTLFISYLILLNFSTVPEFNNMNAEPVDLKKDWRIVANFTHQKEPQSQTIIDFIAPKLSVVKTPLIHSISKYHRVKLIKEEPNIISSA